MGIRNPGGRNPVTQGGRCWGRGLPSLEASPGQGVDRMSRFRGNSHPSPLPHSHRRPPPPSSWFSLSWLLFSWLWVWPCWCGSYGRRGKRRAPTGPAVRSRWVPELHRPPISWEGARCRPRPTQARLQAPEDPHPNLAPRESCCLERSGGLLAGEVPPISFLRQMELGRRLAPLYSVLWLALPTGVFLSSFDSR